MTIKMLSKCITCGAVNIHVMCCHSKSKSNKNKFNECNDKIEYVRCPYTVSTRTLHCLNDLLYWSYVVSQFCPNEANMNIWKDVIVHRILSEHTQTHTITRPQKLFEDASRRRMKKSDWRCAMWGIISHRRRIDRLEWLLNMIDVPMVVLNYTYLATPECSAGAAGRKSTTQNTLQIIARWLMDYIIMSLWCSAMCEMSTARLPLLCHSSRPAECRWKSQQQQQQQPPDDLFGNYMFRIWFDRYVCSFVDSLDSLYIIQSCPCVALGLPLSSIRRYSELCVCVCDWCNACQVWNIRCCCCCVLFVISFPIHIIVILQIFSHKATHAPWPECWMHQPSIVSRIRRRRTLCVDCWDETRSTFIRDHHFSTKSTKIYLLFGRIQYYSSFMTFCINSS